MPGKRRRDRAVRFFLRTVMRRKRVSQGKLAELTGLHLTGISRIVTGKTDPRWSTVLKIAKVLRVPVGAFVRGGVG